MKLTSRRTSRRILATIVLVGVLTSAVLGVLGINTAFAQPKDRTPVASVSNVVYKDTMAITVDLNASGHKIYSVQSITIVDQHGTSCGTISGENGKLMIKTADGEQAYVTTTMYDRSRSKSKKPSKK